MTCRICGHHSLFTGIDLGRMPLVNNLLHSPREAAASWQLRMEVCPTCRTGQLTDAPPPEQLFDQYCYFSSQSRTMVRHAEALVQRFVKPGMFVVEVASNDGYLLAPAQTAGARVLGIDPARNIASHANAIGIPTICDYFNESLACRLADSHGRADVIVANNVFAHVPDPHQLAAGVARLLAPRGTAHIEVPWLRRLLEFNAFDTIYHEHRFYYSVRSLDTLFARHGLGIRRVELMEIHGGSIHLEVTHGSRHPSVDAWLRDEDRYGLDRPERYGEFRARIQSMQQQLTQSIRSARSAGGYGAAAKAAVMLNHFRIDSSIIPWVADVSPHKQGRYLPGTGQCIVDPKILLELAPAVCVIFAWNLVDEIVERNETFLRRGGRFLVPIPEVREITADYLERRAA